MCTNPIMLRAVLFLLCALYPLVGAAQIEPSLTIGGLVSLSGGLEQWCRYIRQGAEIAASEPSTVRVSLVLEDDRSVDKRATLSAAQKLIQVDSADVIFSWTPSTVSVLSQVSKHLSVPLVIAAYDPRMERAGPLVFGGIVDYEKLPRSIVKFFHARGAQRVALVLAADDWSSSFEAPFKEEAARLGMKIVSSDTILPEETETRSLVGDLKLKRVDAVLAPLYGASLISFIRRAREIKLPSTINVGDGMFEGDIITLGALAEGVTAAQLWLESPELAAKVQRRFGTKVNPVQLGLIGSGYDIVKHLIFAAEHIHKSGEAITRETMAKTLQTFSSSGYLGTHMLGAAPVQSSVRMVVVRHDVFTLAE